MLGAACCLGGAPARWAEEGDATEAEFRAAAPVPDIVPIANLDPLGTRASHRNVGSTSSCKTRLGTEMIRGGSCERGLPPPLQAGAEDNPGAAAPEDQAPACPPHDMRAAPGAGGRRLPREFSCATLRRGWHSAWSRACGSVTRSSATRTLSAPDAQRNVGACQARSATLRAELR